MPGNIFGKIFQLVTFGESHGPAIGGVIEGCPAGIALDLDFIQRELDRRKPGNIPGATARKETDEVRFLSGIFEGKTTGTPIAFLVGNKEPRPGDYEPLRERYRPGHADHTYDAKYGIRDHRGGGRASGRETAARVVGGALAKLFLGKEGIEITAYTSRIGPIEINGRCIDVDQEALAGSRTGCPDREKDMEMAGLLRQMEEEGDSVGGTVDCIIRGMPAGIGDPVFQKLSSVLALAVMSIGGARGVEFGSGFEAAGMKGSVHTDGLMNTGGHIVSEQNLAGGIAGGISTGEDICFRVAFKPPSSLTGMRGAISKEGIKSPAGGGRFDACIVPRVLPVVESMAALVIADHLLLNRSAKLHHE